MRSLQTGLEKKTYITQ
jgi:hypothetical protein